MAKHNTVQDMATSVRHMEGMAGFHASERDDKVGDQFQQAAEVLADAAKKLTEIANCIDTLEAKKAS